MLAELEDIEQEELDEQLLEVSGPSTDTLPSVPTSVPSEPAGKQFMCSEPGSTEVYL